MLFSLLASALPPSFTFDVVSGKGLFIASHGIPLVNGSLIQFYKPGWAEGYYSTVGNDQQVKKINPTTLQMTFASGDGLAQGTVTYEGVKDHLKIHYDLVWNGDKPASAEVGAGFLWAPAYQFGSLTADGKPTRALDAHSYPTDTYEARRFGPDASNLTFATPNGAVSEASSIPLTLLDGRGYKQDWSQGHEYFWLGKSDLALEKGKHLEFDVDFQADFTAEDRSGTVKGALIPKPNPRVVLPDSERPPLIPKPETDRLDWQHPLAFDGAFKYPIGEFDHVEEFKAALARRFELPPALPTSKRIALDGGMSKLGLVPGGYKITIAENSISVLGEEDDGLRNGLERLAALAFVSNGKICFPTGFLRDEPHSTFRGVHLFVGKDALPFHQRLWTRVLRPLGFNKVVLQCERTHWDSQPAIDTPLTMPKADLVRLFSMYRNMGVDPIPLIQSFGHMGWFFGNGNNLDLASDRDHPYAIDPSNPKAVEAVTKLWDEAIQTLRPDIVHFGLDEVDLRGKKLSAEEKTRLWSAQLGVLEKIARAHQVQMMLWGDQALAPGEGPDATLAETAKDAADRRSAIPRGSLIGDWHYAANPDPSFYLKSLQTWKDAGLKPIASTWFRPENIAGFDVEAGRLRCGTLQTTWCGYESSEASLASAFDQFTAMVLAADYAWSARPDLPDSLGYDPVAVFRKMYFGTPSALLPKPGTDLALPGSANEPFTIGNVRFGSPGKITLETDLAPSGSGVGGAILGVPVHASSIALAMSTQIQAPDDGIPVAEVVIAFQDGKQLEKRLYYGRDIRSAYDSAPVPFSDRNAQGICSIKIDLKGEKSPIRLVEVKMLNLFTGLVIHGVEGIN